MTWFATFYRSPVGKKAVMAVTGVLLFGFVLVHMLGNLKLYLGPEKINHYAEWLRDVGSPALPHGGLLWIARLVLLAAVALHIVSATQLTLLNRKSRPQSYSQQDYVVSTYAARTMRWGGVLLALYVVYHLAHLTWGNAHFDFVPGDVYHNIVSGFSVWWVSLVYIVANLALGLHLYHGLWSMFQTLGIWQASNPHDWRRRFAQVFALIVTLGNVSFPVAVLVGLVR